MTDFWGLDTQTVIPPDASGDFYARLRDGTSREIVYDHASYPNARVPLNSGAAFPANPFVGQTFVYQADRANGVYWQFVYLPDETVYPWKSIGGPEMRSFVAANEGNGATINTWMDIGTIGPSIIAPLAGDYDMRMHATLTGPAAASTGSIGVAIGAGIPAIIFPSTNPVAAASNYDTSPTTTYTNIVAGAELRVRYWANAANWGWTARYLYAKPVRVRV